MSVIHRKQGRRVWGTGATGVGRRVWATGVGDGCGGTTRQGGKGKVIISK
ncbi:MAG: hypothetical protein ACHBN1_14410 [Heteroscytonema crispum UTEX LB 1556]